MTTRCDSCYKVIHDRSVVALNQKFHPECFVCAHCSKPFPSGKYVVHKNKAYCSRDFENMCRKCSKVIDDPTYVNFEGAKYHGNCFTCDLCRKTLAGKEYFVLDEKPFCKEDYNLEMRLRNPTSATASATSSSSAKASSAPPAGAAAKAKPPASTTTGHKCATCREPIDGDCLKYGDDRFHSWCFKCQACKLMITKGEDFSDYKDGVICGKCHEYLCSRCDEVIKNDFVKFGGKKHHERCFRCAECNTVLDSKDFYELKGRPYCKSDYQRLK